LGHKWRTKQYIQNTNIWQHQYSGRYLVLIVMLIQWPTIITGLMFPVLLFVYYRLSKSEKIEMVNEFGDEYKSYMERTPMFIPKMKRGA
jgi:protein-S-isoprenylcysteine O-methyltransferase Ste14